ncbi:uncharacterized protein HMPREF1541_09582 [Cyphellophora europaea CBS 101466]|uniref:Uncharacterized protein n=1 Tax=Cyphellophora europaea (strain CBS 101466) TaxID=1220924 RepID=W2SCU4_CYPE1|nr:uncharacterized protein HMPREF1541_09582 [Cyphellophora europaea CBS 101466]ETN45749.1 hypothetical protein HMPREF1541_09582 [Cyphellophora europaea CBS 101466]
MDLFNATPTIIRELGLTHSIAAALYFNGEVLGLSCCTVVPSRSPPAGDHVPGSLRPTSTQMITIHQMGVDRFPFPRMRDNMITMNGLFDDDEFARDLLTTPSFQIDAGAPSWEPRAWKVSRQFADKWGFLF